MTVITMTREMGSLGKDVARIVARDLGLSVVHHEISKEAGTSPDGSEVTRFLEATPEEAQRRWPADIGHSGFLRPSEVLALALRGNVLIRGWGATGLLRGLPQVLSVRVMASEPRRIEEMRRRMGWDTARARREIHRNDALHGARVLGLFGEDWRDPSHYDLVLSTDHLSVQACANAIKDAARSTTLTSAEVSRRELEDRVLWSRVDETLHGPFCAVRDRAHAVSAAVDQGTVRLFGVVHDATASHEIENLVRVLPGVQAVRNDIARLSLDG